MRDNAKTPSSTVPFDGQTMIRLALLALVLLWPVLGWGRMAAAVVLTLLFCSFLLPDVAREGERRLTLASTLLEGTGAYALSVLLLIILFHRDPSVVAAVWAMLAAGSAVRAMAEKLTRGAPLPWNPRKSWTGFAGFVVAGAPAAWLLARWAATPPGPSGPSAPPISFFVISVLTALLGAVTESLAMRLHSSYAVALAGGGFMSCLTLFNHWAWAGNLPFLRLRIFVAAAVSLVFALGAYFLRLISRSGAITGFLLAAAVYLAYGYKSFLVLLCFFVLGSGATRLGFAKKAALGVAERRGGARTWREALANGSAAAFFAVFSLLTLPQAAFLAAFVAALAEAAGDTVSSEIGQWLSPRAYMITTFRTVPAGENGGISAVGSAAGLFASAVVVAAGFVLGICHARAAAFALAAAVAGNLCDSLLGATLEKSGYVTNGIVNFASSSLAGGLALALGLHFGL